MVITLLPAALGLIIFFHLFYFLALWKKDFSIVDIAWGLGFIVVGGATLANKSSGASLKDIILLSCISLWGLRLAFYIFCRNKKIDEDFRYQEMRKNWGQRANTIAYFKVFWLQAILLFIVSLPIPIIILQSGPITYFDIIGIILWFVGFSIESIADYQKNSFKQDPNNKNNPLETGLWRYSRHPNYFGEFILWWGIYMMSITSQSPFISLIGPALISFLLLKVSGVPLLEEKYKKYPAYASYAERTNAFFPWFPKS